MYEIKPKARAGTRVKGVPTKPTGVPTAAKKEINGNVTFEVVTLYKAIRTTMDERADEIGAIGYYTTSTMADSARGNDPCSRVVEKKALKVLASSASPDEADYYLLAEEAPVKANVNFEEFTKKLREQALAKLSDGEKIALGLVKDGK